MARGHSPLSVTLVRVGDVTKNHWKRKEKTAHNFVWFEKGAQRKVNRDFQRYLCWNRGEKARGKSMGSGCRNLGNLIIYSREQDEKKALRATTTSRKSRKETEGGEFMVIESEKESGQTLLGVR